MERISLVVSRSLETTLSEKLVMRGFISTCWFNKMKDNNSIIIWMKTNHIPCIRPLQKRGEKSPEVFEKSGQIRQIS